MTRYAASSARDNTPLFDVSCANRASAGWYTVALNVGGRHDIQTFRNPALLPHVQAAVTFSRDWLGARGARPELKVMVGEIRDHLYQHGYAVTCPYTPTTIELLREEVSRLLQVGDMSSPPCDGNHHILSVPQKVTPTAEDVPKSGRMGDGRASGRRWIGVPLNESPLMTHYLNYACGWVVLPPSHSWLSSTLLHTGRSRRTSSAWD
jgi:hypothetical protein